MRSTRCGRLNAEHQRKEIESERRKGLALRFKGGGGAGSRREACM